MPRIVNLLIATILLGAPLVDAQEAEPVDQQMVARIKMEAFQNSQVMETLSYLTDVYGPRLTGSPNFMAAAEWARDQDAQVFDRVRGCLGRDRHHCLGADLPVERQGETARACHRPRKSPRV